jgi:hypothetical protein
MCFSKVGGDFSVKSSAGKERAGIALSVHQQHELDDGGGLEVRFTTSFSPAMAAIQTLKAGVSVIKRPGANRLLASRPKIINSL